MTARRLPDFVIIGAAKAGTTTLYARLAAHPGVFMSTPKEPEFFARDDRYAAGLDAYAALFADAGPDRIAGEASTLYTLAPFFPKTAKRMHEAIPEAKLVYVMRDPVDRAYSYYVQLTKNYQRASRDLSWHRSFEDFIGWGATPREPREKAFADYDSHLPDDPDLCLSGSDYVTQIERYLEFYPREQMLFLDFEDLRSDETTLMHRLLAFLDLSDSGRVAGDAQPHNTAAAHFARTMREKNVDRLRTRMGPLWAVRRLLPHSLRRSLSNWGAGLQITEMSEIAPPPMTVDTRRRLEERFAPMMPRLRELTGLTLERWSVGALRDGQTGQR